MSRGWGFLENIENSHNEAINTLDRLSDISKLKFNNDKTQVLWSDSMKNNHVRRMRDRKFTWDPGIFKILGIKFSVHMEEQFFKF